MTEEGQPAAAAAAVAMTEGSGGTPSKELSKDQMMKYIRKARKTIAKLESEKAQLQGELQEKSSSKSGDAEDGTPADDALTAGITASLHEELETWKAQFQEQLQLSVAAEQASREWRERFEQAQSQSKGREATQVERELVSLQKEQEMEQLRQQGQDERASLQAIIEGMEEDVQQRQAAMKDLVHQLDALQEEKDSALAMLKEQQERAKVEEGEAIEKAAQEQETFRRIEGLEKRLREADEMAESQRQEAADANQVFEAEVASLRALQGAGGEKEAALAQQLEAARLEKEEVEAQASAVKEQLRQAEQALETERKAGGVATDKAAAEAVERVEAAVQETKLEAQRETAVALEAAAAQHAQGAESGRAAQEQALGRIGELEAQLTGLSETDKERKQLEEEVGKLKEERGEQEKKMLVLLEQLEEVEGKLAQRDEMHGNADGQRNGDIHQQATVYLDPENDSSTLDKSVVSHLHSTLEEAIAAADSKARSLAQDVEELLRNPDMGPSTCTQSAAGDEGREVDDGGGQEGGVEGTMSGESTDQDEGGSGEVRLRGDVERERLASLRSSLALAQSRVAELEDVEGGEEMGRQAGALEEKLNDVQRLYSDSQAELERVRAEAEESRAKAVGEEERQLARLAQLEQDLAAAEVATEEFDAQVVALKAEAETAAGAAKAAETAVEAIECRLEEAQTHVASLEAERATNVEKAQQVQEELREELADLRREKEQAGDATEAADNALALELEGCKAKLAEMQNEYEARNERERAHNMGQQEQEQRLAELQQEKGEAIEAAALLQERLDQYQAQIRAAEAERDGCEQSAASAQATHDSLREELAAARQEAAQAAEAAAEEVTSLEKTVADLLSRLEDENCAKEGVEADLSKKVTALESEKAGQVSTMRKLMTKMKKEREEHEQSMTERDSIVTALQQQVDTMEDKNKALSKGEEEKEQALARGREELAAEKERQENEVAAARGKEKEMQEKVQALELQVVAANGEKDSNRDKLKSSVAQLKTMQDRCRELDELYSSSKAELARLKTVETELKELQARSKEEQQAAASLDSARVGLEEKVKRLSGLLKKLQHQSKVKDAELSRLLAGPAPPKVLGVSLRVRAGGDRGRTDEGKEEEEKEEDGDGDVQHEPSSSVVWCLVHERDEGAAAMGAAEANAQEGVWVKQEVVRSWLMKGETTPEAGAEKVDEGGTGSEGEEQGWPRVLQDGFEAEKGMAKAREATLQEKLEQLQTDYSRYKARAHKALKQFTEAGADDKAKDRQILELEERLGAETQEADRKRQGLESEVQDLTERQSKAQEELAEARQALKAAEEYRLQVKALEEKLKETESRATSLREELTADGEEMEGLRKAREAAVTQAKELRVQVEEHKAICQRLEEDLRASTAELDHWKALGGGGVGGGAGSEGIENRASSHSQGNAAREHNLPSEEREGETAQTEHGNGADSSTTPAPGHSTLSRQQSSASVSSTDGGGSAAPPLLALAQMQSRYVDEKGRDSAALAELQLEVQEMEVRMGQLTAQEAVLKSTIRQLEQQLERERELGSSHTGAVNVEYLHQVVTRYIAARDVSEKRQLLPVLSRILHLKKEEIREVEARLVELERSRVRQAAGAVGGVVGGAAGAVGGVVGWGWRTVRGGGGGGEAEDAETPT